MGADDRGRGWSVRVGHAVTIVLVTGVILGLSWLALLYITRGTPVSSIRSFGDLSGPPAPDDSSFHHSVEAIARVDLTGGNFAQVLLNGDQTYPALWRDLRSASRTLTIQFYYAETGAVADSLRAILTERARAGVRIFLLFDAFGSTLPDEWYDALRAAGVSVARFRPVSWLTLHKAQNRSHVRAIVIDSRVGWTGGFGVSDKWLGDGVRRGAWRETNVRFTGPVVLDLQGAFAAAWAEATGTLLTGPTFFPPGIPAPPEGARAGVIFSQPSAGSTVAERFTVLTIAGARRTLYITNSYFVPDDDLRRLLRTVSRRGVDVRILVPGTETDVSAVRYASRYRYEALLADGIRIFEYEPTMVHAKTMVVDGVLTLVGTMNLDNRSMALNDEAVFVAVDRSLGAHMDSVFLRDLRHAREIRLPEFRNRPWTERVVEFAASMLSKLL